MKTVSIGFMRDDGDLTLVATLNNLDGHMSNEHFAVLVDGVKNYIGLMAKRNDVVVLEREDAPDYVELNLDNENHIQEDARDETYNAWRTIGKAIGGYK